MSTRLSPSIIWPTLIRVIGLVQLIIGRVALFYGPLEIYVFYLFSDGGPFHFPSFGVGSLLFATLVAHNIAYYLLALVFIPLGAGSMRLRRWAWPLSQLYLWLWIAGGVLIIINLLILFPVVYDLNIEPYAAIFRFFLVVGFATIFLLLLPTILLRFYRSTRVENVFANADPRTYWINETPMPVLIMLCINGFMILVFHLAIFMQGLFPLLGKLVWGRQAVYILAFCIFLMVLISVGIWERRRWAWRMALVVYGILTVSSTMTFASRTVQDLLENMNLPPYEMEFVTHIVFLNRIYLLTLVILPLVIITSFVLFSRKYFFR